ncbi:MAG TPA: hypothetical protein VF339_00425 [Gammaproteobacteria bacterium]
MIVRYITAAIGGGLITVAMLLGMNEVAQKFKERDPTRYFGIVDFVALPEDRRPARPPAPATPPERPRIDVQTPGSTALPLHMPSVDPDPDRVAPPPLIPEPDPEAPAPDRER